MAAPGEMPATTVASSTEKGAVLSAQHFKRSPTLLFHILAESDRDKQQRKLQQATLPPPADQPESALMQQQQQRQWSSPPPQQSLHLGQHDGSPQPALPQSIPKLQQQQQDSTKLIPAPATPDLLEGLNSRHCGEDVASGAGRGDAGEPETPREGQAALVNGPSLDKEDIVVDGQELSRQQQEQQQQQPKRLRTGPEAPAGGAASGAIGAELDPAAENPTAGAGMPASGSAAEAAVGPGAAATSGLGPGVAPARDLLEEFTPRLILQELLGELFIQPDRLIVQGAFGQGAFATVQRCGLEVAPGGPSLSVAVKSLKPHVLSDLEDLRRFLLEANLLRKLHHPNIVSIHGLGAHDLASLESLRNSAYVVMEALQGGDLRMMILRQMTSHAPAYSRLDALRWCTHVAAACAYLHETCRPMVIHRDLKPENVMLSGGPVDCRVAKITDFGLHKRARYSRTEDVLIAVTNEWSTRGGSVYRWDGNGAAPAAAPGCVGDSVRAGGGTVRGGSGRADYSTYAGSAIDASYYGGNMCMDISANRSASVSAAAALTAGGNGNGSKHHQGFYNNRSTSAHYMALATAGLAAATAEPTGVTANGTASAAGNWSPADGGGGVGMTHRLTPDKLVGSPVAGGEGSGKGIEGGACCVNGCSGVVTGMEATAAAAADAGGSTGPAGSLPPGESIRSGSEAAAELGIAHVGGQYSKVTERERPYLLAYDKRDETLSNYGSKWNSSTDLIGMHDAAVAAVISAATAAAGEAAATSSGEPASPPLWLPHKAISAHYQPPLQPQPQSQLMQHPMGWTPPNVVPPASLEESVHRKMLALMALESAAAATATTAAGVAAVTVATINSTTAPHSVGTDAVATATAVAAEAPFSVTEFVRAATAAFPPEVAAPGPSAVMLMRSMSLALQRQREQQQPHQLPSPALPFGLSTTLGTAATSTQTAASIRGAARAAAMKTVPEHNRMSMDVGSLAAARPGAVVVADGSVAATSAEVAVAVAAARSRASAPPATSAGKRHAEAVHRREKAASTAAKMADATRQVGSLVYMAPELVQSGNYNEKVDVFSFAIIAYELFTGKLLAMKIANEYAFQMEQQGGSGAAARGANLGLGGLPVGGTRSAEEDAEAGVMAYVMRRCGGSREPLPTWWPSQLRELISRCWSQDPANRPSFSQIHRELRRMQQSGALAGMDAQDPLRNVGCGCTIS